MMLQTLEHSIGSAETTCYLTIERFSHHGYSYADINGHVCSLQSFTTYFGVFVGQDVAEKCQQERQLLEMLLEQVSVCIRKCVGFSEICHPDIKYA